MANGPLPQGWSQRANNANEYEAILDLGNFNKYEINVNVQTGQRQIYTIDAVFRTRELLATVNANGTVTRTNAYNNIAQLPNGQTRLKAILDSSRTAANKIVGSVGTPEQKKRLAEQKEFTRLKGGAEPPGSPSAAPSGNTDQGGPNSGGNNADAGAAGATAADISQLRTVENFNDDKSFGTYYYPETIGSKLQDYMMITTYNYQVADIFKQASGADGFFSNVKSGLIFGGANISQKTLEDSLGYVLLPIPSNLTESNQTGWGESSLNSMAAGLMSEAGNVVGSVVNGDLIGGIQDITSAARNVFSKSGGARSQIEQQLTLNAAASLVQKLGIAVDAEAYRARVTGTVINPNLELLFNGPKLRGFQFSFKMAPRTQKEAQQIRGIIKFFKKAMAPKRAKNSADSFFLGAPNVFKIDFMHDGAPSNALPTLKTCALTNFNVNYTADGFYSAFWDGQPVSVQMDMTFAELTPIYNDNYDFDDTVGFKSGDIDNPLFTVRDASATENKKPKNTPPSAQDRAAIRRTVGDTITDLNGRRVIGTPGQLAQPAN